MKSIMTAILLTTLMGPSYAKDQIVIKKIVDQKAEHLEKEEPTGRHFTRRFVLTNWGLFVKLGNDRHYMILTEHGYNGLGPSINVVDIKNEGEYGMQLYYTKTIKQLFPDHKMYWQESGKNQRDLQWIICDDTFPDELKKAFLEDPKNNLE